MEAHVPDSDPDAVGTGSTTFGCGLTRPRLLLRQSRLPLEAPGDDPKDEYSVPGVSDSSDALADVDGVAGVGEAEGLRLLDCTTSSGWKSKMFWLED